jgi:diguanylate cyclase (GGDEF)-like protein
MDELIFAEESLQSDGTSDESCWKILIVDDERDVHQSTLLALGRERLCGRPLKFAHAYSSEEAKQILSAGTDYAVILLDVVMENDQAGFELVRYVREDMAIKDTRIILRTGQPGYAPELESIAKYEINDYKAKSELTRNKLFTTLTASIRSYSQIRALQLSKQGLESIIRASKELLYLRGYREFADGVITQLTALFNLPAEGLVCVKGYPCKQEAGNELQVIAGAGKFRDYILKPVSDIAVNSVVDLIKEAAASKHHIFKDNLSCLYFRTPDQAEMIVYLAEQLNDRPHDMSLLELFSTNIVASIDNVTLLEQRHKYAYRDQLLGVPNRLSFLQSIEAHLQSQTPDLQIILIDIDQFGAINDTIGTENGDILLQHMSGRLQTGHPEQMVARISGDTFGILGEMDELSQDSVAACFEEPFLIKDSAHSLTATQGQVALGGQKAATEVLAQANTALKRAKQTLRGSFQSFQQDMLKETESHVNLLQNLRKAFDQEHLFMVYQPKIDLSTGELSGFEALMRWKNTLGEFVPPIEFIPIAEVSGLIVPLGEWALRRSLVQIKQIREASGLDLTIAVNVSVVQFAQPHFIRMLKRAIEYAGVDPGWLELEVTESFAMHDFNAVKKLIDDIASLGIKVSIDDFGTGFSSLSYLEKLNVQSLKIDKSFIDRITESDCDTRIPETIIRLGNSLGLDVVAEGVETLFQVEWLKRNHCDFAQGYVFAKPLFSDQIQPWIEQHSHGLERSI